MKRPTIVIALVAICFGLSLALAASSSLSARVSGDSQQNRSRTPPPLPPRNSNGAGHPYPTPSPTPCPGIRECTAEENDTPKQLHVAFPGPDNMTLHGHLYVPGVRTEDELAAVTKRYPVMIYNHGSEPDPKGVPYLAKLYLDHGFVFFAPDRHGQGLSKDAGPYIVDLQKAAGSPQASANLHDLYNKDVIAAVKWIKEQPYTDVDHIAMTGISYGGIQTLLTAAKDPGIRAYLPFAPGAESWNSQPIQNKLKQAVENEKAPMFLIQAEGDYNLGPSQTLGPILDHKGNARKWKNRIFPKFGCTNQDAHARFSSHCDGIVIWEQDVLKFLHDAGEL